VIPGALNLIFLARGPGLMIYVKSFLAGVAALILAAVIIIVALFLAGPILELLPHRDEGGVAFDVYGVGSWLNIWVILLGALLIFAAGFYFAFRRSRARQFPSGSEGSGSA
jgi:hypothetical protein